MKRLVPILMLALVTGCQGWFMPRAPLTPADVALSNVADAHERYAVAVRRLHDAGKVSPALEQEALGYLREAKKKALAEDVAEVTRLLTMFDEVLKRLEAQ